MLKNNMKNEHTFSLSHQKVVAHNSFTSNFAAFEMSNIVINKWAIQDMQVILC